MQLISRKSLRSLTTQLLSLLMSLPAEQGTLSVGELSRQYEATHGIPLNPCEYGFISLVELLKSLPYLVEVPSGFPSIFCWCPWQIQIFDFIKSSMRVLSGLLWLNLFLTAALQLFETEDGASKERVGLTPLYQFARSVRALLHTYHYNQIFLTEFLGAFGKYTGKGLLPDSYGYSTVDELLGAIPQVRLPNANTYRTAPLRGMTAVPMTLLHSLLCCQVVWIKGHGHKKIIVLKNDMKG